MKNLRSTTELRGYAVHAADGDIGRVREVYFDDAEWHVKYLVVDTGGWLPGRRVLLPPEAVGDIRWEQREVTVAYTREQVTNAPHVDTDQPVARQRETATRAQHNWALGLGAEALAAVPEALQTPAFAPINKNGKPFDPHLRTTRVVTGLTLRAKDGSVGRIADLIVDDGSWDVLYLVVELGNGTRVVLPPRRVKEIIIDEKVATTDLTRSAVVTGPALDPSTMFTPQYEEAVLQHYRRE